jgi:hypothetical protein
MMPRGTAACFQTTHMFRTALMHPQAYSRRPFCIEKALLEKALLEKVLLEKVSMNRNTKLLMLAAVGLALLASYSAQAFY